MTRHQNIQHARWQDYEQMAHHIILGILGMVCMTYLQKIEDVILGSHWIVRTVSLSGIILLAACWYYQRLTNTASVCLVKIRHIECHLPQEALPAFYPIWLDLAGSDDVSSAEIFDVLEMFM